jgi:hypothetical protein
LKKQIYFVSELPPVNTHASSVVFYRHFKRLAEEGFNITWVTDKNSFVKAKDILPTNWQSIILPNRRWHLPPYRAKGPFQKCRFRYYLQVFLKSAGSRTNESLVISYINGQFLAPFAAYLSHKLNIPLIGFFHDDILELNYFKDKVTLTKNTMRVLNTCSSVFVVSDQFKLNWPKHADKFKVLYPIPENCELSIERRSKTRDFITFSYSGAIYDEIIPFLFLIAGMINRLNHKLVIIGDKSKTEPIQQKFPQCVTCLEFFDTPTEANLFIAENTNWAIVPYPDDIAKMPWISTCYPSKFVQYIQLGIPTIVVAPISSSIGKWCLKHDWPLYLSEYSFDSLQSLLNSTNNETIKEHLDYWRKHDFNPDKIHEKVKNEISLLIAAP